MYTLSHTPHTSKQTRRMMELQSLSVLLLLSLPLRDAFMQSAHAVHPAQTARSPQVSPCKQYASALHTPCLQMSYKCYGYSCGPASKQGQSWERLLQELDSQLNSQMKLSFSAPYATHVSLMSMDVTDADDKLEVQVDIPGTMHVCALSGV
jgi:hypothetical protein